MTSWQLYVDQRFMAGNGIQLGINRAVTRLLTKGELHDILHVLQSKLTLTYYLEIQCNAYLKDS